MIRTIRFLALAAVVAGCAPSAGECVEARAYLDGPKVSRMPRRYWDYTDHTNATELAAAVVGCKQSARDRDCAEVKRLLDHPFATPPGADEFGIWDPAPFESLKTMKYRDPAVREAAQDYVQESGWTVYTPYSAEAQTSNSHDRLAKLCGLKTITVSVESQR
jgi:hypothetical protein